MEAHSPLTATVRVEFVVDLKAVQHRIIRKAEPQSRLRRTLVLAHQLKHLLESRQMRSMVKLAKWLKLTFGRVSQMMSLLYLAPDIQEQILCSNEVWIQQVTEEEARKIVSELLWEKQRKRWDHLLAYHRALAGEEVGAGGTTDSA
jgi:hypothetical protein